MIHDPVGMMQPNELEDLNNAIVDNISLFESQAVLGVLSNLQQYFKVRENEDFFVTGAVVDGEISRLVARVKKNIG